MVHMRDVQITHHSQRSFHLSANQVFAGAGSAHIETDTKTKLGSNICCLKIRAGHICALLKK